MSTPKKPPRPHKNGASGTDAGAAPPSPTLAIFDAAEFRRKLAGLVDPLGPRAGAAGRENLKQASSRLCMILAKLYGVSDDRTKLWEHVGKALQVADEKTSDDDVEHFVSECLALVNAEPGQSAADEDLGSFLSELVSWPPEHRHEWLNYLRSHRYSVLTFGRQKWEEFKAAGAARRAQRRSGS